MDKKLYKKLLGFRSHSKSETQILFRDWLQAYIESNYDNVITTTDSYGNLYVQKSTDFDYDYVNCVVAHLDINQKTQTDDFSIIEVGGFIIGVDNNTGLQIGLGHDDKTGVYFALQALRKFDNIKCFFPLDEEVGLVGTRASMDEFFEDVGFFLQLDRRGYNDISHYTNGHKTIEPQTKKEFERLICKYNFHWVNTISTDVGYLTERHLVQGTNMSCGYKDEHTNNETLHILRYKTSERFGLELLKLTDNKFYPLYLPITTPKATTTTETSTVKPVEKVPTNANTSTTVVKPIDKTASTEVKPADEKKKSDTDMVMEMSPMDNVEYAIESLLDIPIANSTDVRDFKNLLRNIGEAWALLENGYDKDMLYLRLFDIVRDINFSLEGSGIGDLNKEEESLAKYAKRLQELYSWGDDYEDTYLNNGLKY